METFHTTPWLPEIVEMKQIEELLKCGICHDFLETTVMTPCSHNYCSLCIRKYLHYKTQCPACFQTTFEKDLRTNRILDDMIMHFVKIRMKLVDCVSNTEKDTATSDNFNKLSILSMSFRSTTLDISNDYGQSSPTFDARDHIEKLVVNTDMLITGTADVSKNDVFQSSNDKQVSCPVCQVNISQIHINRHLDECIKRESLHKQSFPRIDDARKLMPKLVFNLMKDSELKKKMKHLNLPTQGDRRTLESRFQRYCTLYNAESDKKNPRSAAALLEQCKDEEWMEKKLAKSSLEINKLKVSRNAEQNVIDDANNKYLKMNAQSYQHLIESIKTRGKHKKFDDEPKLNDNCVMTSMHNDVRIRECHELFLSPNTSMIFNRCSQHPSGPPTVNSFERVSVVRTNSIINNQLNATEQIKMNTIANEEGNYGNDRRNTDGTENCSSINGLTTACYTTRKNEPLLLENKDNESDVTVSSNIQPIVPLPIKLFQHNKNNKNLSHGDNTDNKNISNKSDDCTIKRRRRQKCYQSSVKSP